MLQILLFFFRKFSPVAPPPVAGGFKGYHSLPPLAFMRAFSEVGGVAPIPRKDANWGSWHRSWSG